MCFKPRRPGAPKDKVTWRDFTMTYDDNTKGRLRFDLTAVIKDKNHALHNTNLRSSVCAFHTRALAQMAFDENIAFMQTMGNSNVPGVCAVQAAMGDCVELEIIDLFPADPANEDNWTPTEQALCRFLRARGVDIVAHYGNWVADLSEVAEDQDLLGVWLHKDTIVNNPFQEKIDKVITWAYGKVDPTRPCKLLRKALRGDPAEHTIGDKDSDSDDDVVLVGDDGHGGGGGGAPAKPKGGGAAGAGDVDNGGRGSGSGGGCRGGGGRGSRQAKTPDTPEEAEAKKEAAKAKRRARDKLNRDKKRDSGDGKGNRKDGGDGTSSGGTPAAKRGKA